MRFAPISDRAGPVPVPFMEQYARERPFGSRLSERDGAVTRWP